MTKTENRRGLSQDFHDHFAMKRGVIVAGTAALACVCAFVVVLSKPSDAMETPRRTVSVLPATANPSPLLGLGQSDPGKVDETRPKDFPAPVETVPPSPFHVELQGQFFDSPRTAIAFAEGLDPELRNAEMVMVIEEWARFDVEGAIGWVNRIKEPRMHVDLFGHIGANVAASSPERAVELAHYLADPAQRNDYLKDITHVWANRAPANAAVWADSVADAAVRGEIQKAVAIEWAQSEPAAAADYIATRMAAGDAQDSSAVTVARRWATLDVSSAKAWAEQFPAGDLRDGVLAVVMSVQGER